MASSSRGFFVPTGVGGEPGRPRAGQRGARTPPEAPPAEPDEPTEPALVGGVDPTPDELPPADDSGPGVTTPHGTDSHGTDSHGTDSDRTGPDGTGPEGRRSPYAFRLDAPPFRHGAATDAPERPDPRPALVVPDRADGLAGEDRMSGPDGLPGGAATAPAGLAAVTAPRRVDLRRRSARRAWPDPAPWAVGAVTLVLRLVTAASGPTDWDSAQYASAVRHFDVTHGRPQPPGYWLYVEAGAVVKQVTGLGTVHSLVLVAALASAAAAALATVAGSKMGGRWVGLATGAVLASSPFLWFSGSIVATYSFDALACSLLVLLAWQARPGGWHGVGAVVAFALLAGFRQSVVQAFAVLALIPVVASTRTWRRLAVTVAAGLAAVAVWFVPMVLSQPGGLEAWRWATQSEARGAAEATSVLDHAANGTTNLGTFAAYTVVALAPLAVLALAAGVACLVRRWALGPIAGRATGPSPTVPVAALPTPLVSLGPDLVPGAVTAAPGTGGARGTPGSAGAAVGDGEAPATGPDGAATVAPAPGGAWARPWYQTRTAVLAAAIVPPVAIVALVQFAKGGYLLAYLPAAVIALLLPVGALNRRVHRARAARQAGHRRRTHTGSSLPWLVVTTLGVALVVALGAQRFLGGEGVLPQRWLRATSGVWLQQPRYQAPYDDTRAAITSADSIDTALRGLARSVDPARDVVVFDTVDGGANLYRNAGWSLPEARIALVEPGRVLYNELHGSLYYASGDTVLTGVAGSVYLVASPAMPGLTRLTATGTALPVATPQPIGEYRVWRVLPGASLLEVQVTATAGHRPLGHGLTAPHARP